MELLRRVRANKGLWEVSRTQPLQRIAIADNAITGMVVEIRTQAADGDGEDREGHFFKCDLVLPPPVHQQRLFDRAPPRQRGDSLLSWRPETISLVTDLRG